MSSSDGIDIEMGGWCYWSIFQQRAFHKNIPFGYGNSVKTNKQTNKQTDKQNKKKKQS